jgi:hypothetical protein
MAVKTLDKKLTVKEYEQHLLSNKLISRVPNRTGKLPKELVNFKRLEIKGESLSESIIKERR